MAIIRQGPRLALWIALPWVRERLDEILAAVLFVLLGMEALLTYWVAVSSTLVQAPTIGRVARKAIG